jgi:two-component system sensor histidine kinase MtrB
VTDTYDTHGNSAKLNGWKARLFRLTSLRLRLVAVFAAVALTAAVSASGIAYWLNRDAVLTRAQNAALNDFRASMSRNAGSLPGTPSCEKLEAARTWRASSARSSRGRTASRWAMYRHRW